MSKESTLIVLGVLVMLSPFLGLPQSWLAVILPILGAAVLVVAYFIRQRRRPRALGEEAPAPEAERYEHPVSPMG